MELKILEERPNPLMKRTEYRFEVAHPGSATPKREEIRSELARMAKVPKERLVLEQMRAQFGTAKSRGEAFAYLTKEAVDQTVREHILVRNGLREKAVKTPPAAAEPPTEKPATKTVEKPAEKAAEKPAGPPAEPTAEKSAGKPSEPAAEKHPAKPVEKPAEKAAEKGSEKPAEPRGEKHSEKRAEKASGKSEEKPAGKPVDKPPHKAREKSAKSPEPASGS